MKRSSYYIILAIVFFAAFSIYYFLQSNRLLSSTGRYTIGTVDKMKPAGNGMRVYISFFYKDVKQERDYIEDIGKIKKLEVGQKFFIKFIPSDNRAFDFNSDCFVPESIKNAPFDGWSEEWMQEHFPECKK